VTAPDLSFTRPLYAAEGRCNRMDLRTWFNLFRAAAQREEGQTMAEYGVTLALITLAVVGVIGALGLAISGKFGEVKNVLVP
jgi:Flp pilus assembly pilin Flp